jgi:hypothetical protein
MSFDVRPYAKAVTAAVVAGASFAIPVVDDGLTTSEVLGIAVAALTAFGTVWGIPNKDPEGDHQDESVQPPDDEEFDASKPVRGYGSGV